jgi:hypothetical protein
VGLQFIHGLACLGLGNKRLETRQFYFLHWRLSFGGGFELENVMKVVVPERETDFPGLRSF